MGAGETFAVALRALKQSLDELDAPFAVIGGIAVIFQGVPRATSDIDALTPPISALIGVGWLVEEDRMGAECLWRRLEVGR